MKVSQLLYRMDRTDYVSIFDGSKNIDENRLYQGEVRGIKKDNPVNGYLVVKLFAYEDVVIMEVELPRVKMKGGVE